MEQPYSISCDLHGGDYATRAAVSGDIGIHGAGVSRIYGDVCNSCISKLVALIDDNFPKQKLISK
jgi:hypothetical protein